MSNLRQIGQLIEMYQHDNDGWTPAGVYTWFGQPGSGPNDHYHMVWRVQLEPYVERTSRAYFCPIGVSHLGGHHRNSVYRLRPRSSSLPHQHWNEKMLVNTHPSDFILMQDTSPFYHGREESPQLYFDKSVRIGKWQNFFNEGQFAE
ncbi:hypothetical protein ACERK3_14290 [Phycisphaerales bacterium AB-hyl4]|uniref:Uncharacterized protein n=1 Tax=Natronomicrosphaera hydrolytica TaxID=3242702 RepID=A0ABV4UA90_9BACT